MKLRAAAFTSLLIAAACGSPETLGTGAGSRRPTAERSSPTATGSPAHHNLQWKRFESAELRLSFQFPVPPGETGYEFPESHAESGASFAFWVERFDRPDSDPDIGWSYAFAGGASRDLVAPRMSWITDNVKWERSAGKYRVLIGNGSYRVEPIRIVTRSDGLQALVFDPNPWFWQGQEINPNKTDRAAILNFGAGYHRALEGITFYFYDQTSLADIERVVRSVRFPED